MDIKKALLDATAERVVRVRKVLISGGELKPVLKEVYGSSGKGRKLYDEDCVLLLEVIQRHRNVKRMKNSFINYLERKKGKN